MFEFLVLPILSSGQWSQRRRWRTQRRPLTASRWSVMPKTRRRCVFYRSLHSSSCQSNMKQIWLGFWAASCYYLFVCFFPLCSRFTVCYSSWALTLVLLYDQEADVASFLHVCCAGRGHREEREEPGRSQEDHHWEGLQPAWAWNRQFTSHVVSKIKSVVMHSLGVGARNHMNFSWNDFLLTHILAYLAFLINI